MIELNEIYTNELRAENFIYNCENNFKRNIRKIAESIAECKNISIVTLCGPTCSGKTTTASILTSHLESLGKKARVLSIDDFYFDEDVMIKNNITDFEGPDAIDLDLLESVLSQLSKKRITSIPTFDFVTHKRIAMTEYIPHHNDIYILEGIQAMYPEVQRILKGIGYKSIYISVAKTLKVCGMRFTKEELRLIRRIVRDHYHRDTTPVETMSMWPSVRKNEEKNIYPHITSADYVINSLMPYEILLLSKFFIDITENYPVTSKGYTVIEDLRRRLLTLVDNCITADFVPPESVFREFIV